MARSEIKCAGMRIIRESMFEESIRTDTAHESNPMRSGAESPVQRHFQFLAGRVPVGDLYALAAIIAFHRKEETAAA